MKTLTEFFEAGYVAATKPRILDIGCSNLHSASADQLEGFIRARNDVYDPASLRRWAELAALGGVMDPELGGVNGLWLGDLLNRAGLPYIAFDIFPGYRTEFFDLNADRLAEHHRAAYDVVFNFGTTEHLIGQYNAFKTIHEATAPGGVMFHDLPMTGYLDHGYFCYNPMLFMHLADANGYEVLSLSFSGGMGGESIAAGFYEKYGHRDFFKAPREENAWRDAVLPTASIAVIARKVREAPFRTSLETSTTVGVVTDQIGRNYGAAELGDGSDLDEVAAVQRQAREKIHAALRRGGAPDLALEEIMDAYRAHQEAGLKEAFPLTLEARALSKILADDPSQAQSAERAQTVAALRLQRHPLLAYIGRADGVAPPLHFDGAEAHLDIFGDESRLLGRILAAYAAYDRTSAVELFPLRLELRLLQILAARGEASADMQARIGRISPDGSRERTLPERVEYLLRRTSDPSLTYQEIMDLYADISAAGGDLPFPKTLEIAALHKSLERDPDNAETKARIGVVESTRLSERPLLKLSPCDLLAPGLLYDGEEAGFVTPDEPRAALELLLRAYHAYHAKMAVELFPKHLEIAALRAAIACGEGDHDLRARLALLSSDPNLSVAQRLDQLLRRVVNGDVLVEEIMDVHGRFLREKASGDFPLTLERLALMSILEKTPEDESLRNRLVEVEAMRRERFPLLKELDSAAVEMAADARFDGLEAAYLDCLGDPTAAPRLMSLYKAYAEHAAVELFPPALEAEALVRLCQAKPEEKLAFIRLGRLSAEVLPAMTLAERGAAQAAA